MGRMRWSGTDANAGVSVRVVLGPARLGFRETTTDGGGRSDSRITRDVSGFDVSARRGSRGLDRRRRVLGGKAFFVHGSFRPTMHPDQRSERRAGRPGSMQHPGGMNGGAKSVEER